MDASANTGARVMGGSSQAAMSMQEEVFRRYSRNMNGEMSEVIREYVYEDDRGEPYLRVERSITKQFRQSRWVQRGLSGRWEYGAPRGPKLPYMLRSLLDAKADDPVFICEGEKDVETLIDMGLLATCNPGGAGKWSADLNRWFVGSDRPRTVFVLQDNDDAGRLHAQKVARLLSPVVETLKIIALPGLQEKGDVSDWVSAGGTKDDLLGICSDAVPFVHRATIEVYRGEIARAVDDTEAALLKAEQPVFVRAGTLVQPLSIHLPSARGGTTLGSVLRPLTSANLAYIVTKHVTYARYNARFGATKPIDPPESILRALLERGHWNFPNVVGTVNAPTLRPDGTVLHEHGYDPVTQLWCSPDPSLAFQDFDAAVSKDDALKSLELLKDLISEFPFAGDAKQTSINRAVALAAILTSVLRGAFTVAPMFLFAAHAPGTGKSYLVNLIATIVHGRPCPVITASRSTEEMEKRLASLLLEGLSMISVDNCTFDLNGDLLCQITEQPAVKVRVLGTNTAPQCEWRGVMFATGNNITLSGDMVRRGLTCSLDARTEQPESRAFRLDPVARVLQDRAAYIGAALSIARAYITFGERVDCRPIGSYSEWSKFVREPLIWLGEPDPLLSMEQGRANDPERSAARELIRHLRECLESGRSYSVRDIATLARETRALDPMGANLPDSELMRPGLNDLLTEKCPAPRGGIDTLALGKWFGRLKGQVHCGFRIVPTRVSSSHGNRWALEKCDSGEEVQPATR